MPFTHINIGTIQMNNALFATLFHHCADIISAPITSIIGTCRLILQARRGWTHSRSLDGDRFRSPCPQERRPWRQLQLA